jgi:hypothetical protein
MREVVSGGEKGRELRLVGVWHREWVGVGTVLFLWGFSDCGGYLIYPCIDLRVSLMTFSRSSALATSSSKQQDSE